MMPFRIRGGVAANSAATASAKIGVESRTNLDRVMADCRYGVALPVQVLADFRMRGGGMELIDRQAERDTSTGSSQQSRR